MPFPAIRLHQLYSLNFYNGLDIIFEDLELLNMHPLEEVINTKKLGNINIIDKKLSINTDNKTVTIVGYKINTSTYIVKHDGSADIIVISYRCADKDILTALEYLYRIYKNLDVKELKD